MSTGRKQVPDFFERKAELFQIDDGIHLLELFYRIVTVTCPFVGFVRNQQSDFFIIAEGFDCYTVEPGKFTDFKFNFILTHKLLRKCFGCKDILCPKVRVKESGVKFLIIFEGK